MIERKSIRPRALNGGIKYLDINLIAGLDLLARHWKFL